MTVKDLPLYFCSETLGHTFSPHCRCVKEISATGIRYINQMWNYYDINDRWFEIGYTEFLITDEILENLLNEEKMMPTDADYFNKVQMMFEHTLNEKFPRILTDETKTRVL